MVVIYDILLIFIAYITYSITVYIIIYALYIMFIHFLIICIVGTLRFGNLFVGRLSCFRFSNANLAPVIFVGHQKSKFIKFRPGVRFSRTNREGPRQLLLLLGGWKPSVAGSFRHLGAPKLRSLPVELRIQDGRISEVAWHGFQL